MGMKRISLCCFILFSVFAVYAEDFNINKFTDPQKYGWQSWEDRMQYRSELYERQKLLQIYEIEAQSISGNMLKSAVFPGWGQFNSRYYTKGQVFLAAEIALLGTSLFFYDRAMDKYDKYKTATQIDQMNEYYHQAQTPYQYSMVFLTFATVVWAYNLFDVVQSTEDYNAGVWEKTIKTYYEAPVSLTPEGVQIRF
jgi:hypothetical protein